MTFLGNPDCEITDIAVDSRAVTPGTLFIALKGLEQNGHDFIPEAIQRGAAAIVMEESYVPPNSKQASSPVILRVADSKEALAHLAPYFFDHPALGLQLIGVTGTNGKTTTSYLIDAVLRENRFQSGLLSTVTYRLGTQEIRPLNTTPGLLDLHRFFSMARGAGLSHVVMEVSSHALDQERVKGLYFESAVFTNLSEEHLDYHETMAAYFEAKKKLFDQVDGRALINADDVWGRRLLEEVSCPAWTYGIEERGDLFPLRFSSTLNGIAMTVQSPVGEIEVVSALVGRHNIYNLLAAIGVGLSLGLSKDVIVSGIESMHAVPGRFEVIDEGQDFTVVVDYAHTADALSRLLQTVTDLARKDIVTLFGCGGDRDRGKRPKMARAAAALSQKIILTSDNPRTESPLSIIEEIEKGFERSGADMGRKAVDYETIVDRREAIARAIDEAQAGDVIVIAGKGHESDQQIGKERIPFDDREIARCRLKRRLAFHKKGSDVDC